MLSKVGSLKTMIPFKMQLSVKWSFFVVLSLMQFLHMCQASCYSEPCIGPGLPCNTNEVCLTNFTCNDYTNENQNRCLCSVNYFEQNNSCVSVDSLRVYAVNFAGRGTDYISLTWTTNNPANKNVSYYIETSGQSVLANTTGGTIRNLISGQSYTLYIASLLSEMFYPMMKTSLRYYYPIRTMIQYNQSCSSQTDSDCETGTECVREQPMGYCLCSSSNYRFNNACVPKLAANVSCSSADQCKSNMTCTSNKVCGCNNDQYLYADSCYTKKLHGLGCNINDECSIPYVCRSMTLTVNKYCLCDENNYRTLINSCNPVTALEVKNVTLITKTVSSFSWNWTWSNAGNTSVVMFTILTNDGKTGTGTASGGIISGLDAGTQYNITVVSTLMGDNLYGSQNTSVTFGPVWTTNTYAGSCSDSTSDCVAGTTCIKPFNSSNTLCLCDSSKSYATDDFNCLSLSNLQVKDVQWTTGTHSIHFTWSTTHVLRANATYAIIDATNSNTVKTSSGATGASLTNLVPGTKYSLKIRSELQNDSYYSNLNYSVNVPDIVTYPANPGKVFNVTLQSDPTNTGQYFYKIEFLASEGKVTNYTFIIKTNNDVIDTLVNITPSVISNKLTPVRIYLYEITAQNTVGNMSEKTTGIFSTPSSPSDEPSNLQIPTDNITADTAIVTWQMPKNPNGNITGYVLYVTSSNQSCLQVYSVGCTDCSLQNVHTPAKCQAFEIIWKNFTFNELNSNNITISLDISNLDPYSDYTVVVLPLNEAGQGKQANQSFATKITRASNVVSIKTSATRDSNKVGLNVTWIPGRFTGPTNYTVKLEEKISLSSDSYTTKDTQEAFGYDINFAIFDDLLGYWDYRVTVTAYTVEGHSSPIIENPKTLIKSPGLATFSIAFDPVIATKVTISINCPEEKERNGIIIKYTVKKMLWKINNNELDTVLYQNISRTLESENPCEVTNGLLTNIMVERVYSIEVMTINQELTGNYSEGLNFNVPAKLPIALGKDIVQFSNPTYTTLDVTVCRDCVANDAQGKIQDLWLAVCAEKSDCFSSPKRTRSVVEPIVNSTWLSAKKSGFTIGYRTTPLEWLIQLRASQASVIDFTIGSDSACEIGDYCNGPLPSNTIFKILVIICNNAGCVPVSSELVATKGEEANYTALAIGLGIGLPCIIIIIIVAVICIKQHLRNKKLEAMRRQEPLYNTPSRTFQDDHLYGVANDNMTPVVSEPEEVSQSARNEDVYQEIPDYNNFPDERFQIYQNIETAVERS